MCANETLTNSPTPVIVMKILDLKVPFRKQDENVTTKHVKALIKKRMGSLKKKQNSTKNDPA